MIVLEGRSLQIGGLKMQNNFYYDVLSDCVKVDFDPKDYIPNDMAVEELIENIDLSNDCGNYLVMRIEGISSSQAQIASNAAGQKRFDFVKLGLVLVGAAITGYLISTILLQLPGEYCFVISMISLCAALLIYYLVSRYRNSVREKEAVCRGSFAEHALNELLAKRQKTDFFTRIDDAEIRSQKDFERLISENQNLVTEINFFDKYHDDIEAAMIRR